MDGHRDLVHPIPFRTRKLSRSPFSAVLHFMRETEKTVHLLFSKMAHAITLEEDHDQRYSEYKAIDKHRYDTFKVYNILKKLTQKYKFKNTLDVGCADGSFSAKLMNNFGFEAHGIDISKNAVELANQKGVKAKRHNLEKPLPYPDNHFDLVFSCEVIEHMYDTDFFISELKRVLKRGGILLLTTPNLVSLVNRTKILFGKYPDYVPEYHVGGPGHIRAYTIPVLKKQLTAHGLKVFIIVSPNLTFPMRSRKVPNILKKIAIRLGDIFPKLGSHMIIVSKK